MSNIHVIDEEARLSRLDLNLLRVLAALDRTRSVTAAGRALGLSQPAASNALARLRHEFGDVLFVRTPRGLVPTAVGARVASVAGRHLEALERDLATPVAFDPATSTATWRLSLSDLGEMVFLPAIADALLRAAPAVRIVNAAVPADEVGAALARREIDLAIGILASRQRGIRSALLFRETYVALSARPRSRRSPREATGLIVAAPTATFHGGVERSLVRAGLGARIVMRTRHYAAMIDLVRSVPLAAVVPKTWAEAVRAVHRDLVIEPLPAEVPWYDVRMLWHATTDADPALGWMRERMLTALSRK